MDQLFAPWRIEWVTRDPDPAEEHECVFCSIPERDADRDNLLVARSEHAFVLLNNYPYNPGHVMVIPRAHTGSIEDLSDEELLSHARLTQRTVGAVEHALDAEGVNVGMNLGKAAGGSIDDHLHTHVIPRWHGDTNFMPIIDDTTVIVEALDETYEHLHAAFAAQDGAVVRDENRAIEFDRD